MPATILRREEGRKLCRCQNCGTEFWIDPQGWWQNHFYCGEGCCAQVRARLKPKEDEYDEYWFDEY